ncbi:rRNA methyltransferase 3, mitochondrial isoform X1 [Bacillus rossius redtenbacheri]|uniref:rRNA methyltransferase 3, mitochondrial isoform X1 n=1 Tax=Bacillus rossius redtenbacheri TaxID=93214 RepID=UPI002FDD1A56
MHSNLMSSVKSKKQREKKGYILLEGRRLIADSLAAGVVPRYVFFSRTSDVAGLRLPATQLYKIPYKTISLWSDVTTSQGVIAICKLPASEDIESSGEELPLTIVCDNVREPGNLGAILRTAVGAGCRQVVLTKGCMDLWDPKVLRSGVGAHFRMKIFRDVAWEEVSDILGTSFVCLADNNLGDADCGESETGEHDQEAKDPQARHTVPVVPYYDVNYARQTSVVLVLGGEAHGLSPSAYQLAASRKGVRVHIPLANGTESLNTGTALGVIVFEMKRQFLTRIPDESEDDSFSVTKG